MNGKFSYSEILRFWFEEIDPSLWWVNDNAFDNLITDKFSDIHATAVCCELFEWRQSSHGRLAEVIVLDQFSRNIYRGTAKAFENDGLALALAQEAIAAGADITLNAIQRSFLYLPFMHSESLAIHEQALALYQGNNIQANLDFEIKHKRIIEKFGRYPHRNQILGRSSTEAELEFLKRPEAWF